MDTEEKEINLYELWLEIQAHLGKLVVASLGVGILAFALSLLLPNEFTATARVASSNNTEALNWLMTGESVITAMDKQFDLRKHYELASFHQLKQRWSRQVVIRRLRQTNFIDVSVTDKQPEFAMNLANQIAAFAKAEIVRQQLSEPSRQLAQQLILLNEAKKQEAVINKALEHSEGKKALINIGNFEHYMLEAIARSQAEIASAEGEIRGTPKETTYVWEMLQLLSLQKENVDKQNKTLPLSHSQIEALRLLQRHVYWQSLVENYERKLPFLQAQAYNDTSLEPAQLPDFKSGPNRRAISLVATFLTALLGVVLILVGPFWHHLKKS